MPINDLAPRARELGRIRAGDKVPVMDKATGKPKVKDGRPVTRPNKLDTWRLTSPQREYVQAAADVYGGTVGEWKDGPTDGDQWQVVITAEHLDVLVPPLDVVDGVSQWYEMWSGGGCLRRCTGQYGGPGGSDLAQGDRCLCPSDLATRLELSKKLRPEACKPTTRVTLILPRLPDLGVWVLVSHGVNAAVELPGTVALLQRFAGQGVWVPGRLRLDPRTRKKDGQTNNFGVPVIEVPQITFGELIAGSGQRVLGGEQAAVEAGLRALPSGGDREDDVGAPPPGPAKGSLPSPPAATAAKPGAFSRSVRTAASRAGVDDTLLASICEEITGNPDVDAIHDPGHVNAVLDELKVVAKQLAASKAS